MLDASRAVNSVLGVREALQVVLARAKELLEAHEGSVMLLGDDGHLRVVASEGIPPEVAASTSIPLGEGVAGKVAAAGVPVVLGDPPDESQFTSFIHKERPLLSGISVPLRAVGRTVGVLNLNLARGPRRFGPADVSVAQVFAEQAATAIYKAQLLEEASGRADELALLFEAGRRIVGVLDMEPLLTGVLDAAMRLAAARCGFVCLIDQPSGQLSLGVYRGAGREAIRTALTRPGFVGLLEGEGPEVFRVGDSEVFAGVGDPEDVTIVLPMRAEGATSALLVLIGGSPGEHRLRLCQTFAAQAALGIRNAQLYRNVEEKEAQLAAIVSSMVNPVVVLDGGGNVVVANPAAEDLFGFAADFVRGQAVRGLLGDPSLEALLTGEGGRAVEVSAGRPTPRTFKARVSSINAPGAAGGGRILVMEDVTAEREMERLKADFVAVVGHELRTPLTLIKGYLRTLIRRGDKLNPEQVREALTTADAQAQRLERLIEDLLYVSRIERDRAGLHVEAGDMAQIARGLLVEFEVREPGRPLALEAPESVPVTMDRSKVEQVLYHLLDNACKYSSPGAPVAVRIAERSGEVEVSVTDRGVGILSGDLPRLFERFHQVDSTSTREHGGTGVGLYICRSLVEEHGGRIAVESIWGRGTTFRFTIPKGLEAGKPAHGVSLRRP